MLLTLRSMLLPLTNGLLALRSGLLTLRSGLLVLACGLLALRSSLFALRSGLLSLSRRLYFRGSGLLLCEFGFHGFADEFSVRVFTLQFRNRGFHHRAHVLHSRCAGFGDRIGDCRVDFVL